MRFVDELKSAGIAMFGMTTRAEMIEARDWVPDQLAGATEDDDSSYGPGSYFNRAVNKDD